MSDDELTEEKLRDAIVEYHQMNEGKDEPQTNVPQWCRCQRGYCRKYANVDCVAYAIDVAVQGEKPIELRIAEAMEQLVVIAKSLRSERESTIEKLE